MASHGDQYPDVMRMTHTELQQALISAWIKEDANLEFVGETVQLRGISIEQMSTSHLSQALIKSLRYQDMTLETKLYSHRNTFNETVWEAEDDNVSLRSQRIQITQEQATVESRARVISHLEDRVYNLTLHLNKQRIEHQNELAAQQATHQEEMTSMLNNNGPSVSLAVRGGRQDAQLRTAASLNGDREMDNTSNTVTHYGQVLFGIL